MKILRALMFAAALAAFSAIAFPVGAADLTKDLSCACTCCKAVRQTGSALGGVTGGFGTPSTVKACTDDTKTDTAPVSAASKDDCSKLCADKGEDQVMRSCTKGDCWCKNGKDAQFIGQSANPEACALACKEAKLEFGNWGAPPAVSTSAVKCPPGGMWTKEECEAQTDSFGERIGEWLPPSSSFTKGPYCYVLQRPVKLAVAIGGLTSANLAQYLAAAFRLGLGMAAVLAVIFMMIGGFRYMTAAGGSAAGDGKTMIRNAVVGLVLTAVSYTLLQTVNPDIVSLRLPRTQIVKPCNVQVSCAAKEDKESCEKNDSASGVRCIWNIVQSSCYDNSLNESGAVGKSGGECQRDDQGNFRCVDGSKCIELAQYGDRSHVCSRGEACQACEKDADCANQNGAPGKCQDKVCVVPDPNGQPGSYLKCGNGSCKKNTDCDSGFCNGSGRCAASGQGTNCMVGSQNDCANGYQCIEFYKPFQAPGSSVIENNLWKKICCLNGDTNACMGCATDSDCPAIMRCNTGDSDPKTKYKCVIR